MAINKSAQITRPRNIVPNTTGKTPVSTRERTTLANNTPITLSVPNTTSLTFVENTSKYQKLPTITKRDVHNTRFTPDVPNTRLSANVSRDGTRSREHITRDGLILIIMPFVNKNVTRFASSTPSQKLVLLTNVSNSVLKRDTPRNVSSLSIENSVLLKRKLVSVPNGFQIISVIPERKLECVKSIRNVDSVPSTNQSTFVLNTNMSRPDVKRESIGRNVFSGHLDTEFVPNINLLVEPRSVSNMERELFVKERNLFVLQLRLTSTFQRRSNLLREVVSSDCW